MLLLGIELRTSGRAFSALNCFLYEQEASFEKMIPKDSATGKLGHLLMRKDIVQFWTGSGPGFYKEAGSGIERWLSS